MERFYSREKAQTLSARLECKGLEAGHDPRQQAAGSLVGQAARLECREKTGCDYVDRRTPFWRLWQST